MKRSALDVLAALIVVAAVGGFLVHTAMAYRWLGVGVLAAAVLIAWAFVRTIDNLARRSA